QFSRSSFGECQRSDLIEPYRQYVRLVTGLNETTAYLCTRVRDLPTTHFQHLEWAIVSGVPARITGDDTETHPWPLSEREKVGCLLAHDFAITYHALQHLLVYQHPEVGRVLSLQDFLALHPSLGLCLNLVHTTGGVKYRLCVSLRLCEQWDVLAVEDLNDLCGHLVLDVLTEPIRIMASAGEEVKPLEMSAGVPCLVEAFHAGVARSESSGLPVRYGPPGHVNDQSHLGQRKTTLSAIKPQVKGQPGPQRGLWVDRLTNAHRSPGSVLIPPQYTTR